MLIVVAIILSAFMAAVMYYDVSRYIIPNWLNAALLLLFPVWYFIAPEGVEIVPSLYMFGALFAGGFILFALRVMGGGDVKLLAVTGLYVGWGEVALAYMVYVALLGGLLSVLLLASRYVVPLYYARFNRKTMPLIFTMGGPVPYGLAIAGAFLILLWLGELPGLPLDVIHIGRL